LAVTIAAIILLAPVVLLQALVLYRSRMAVNEFMGIVLKNGCRLLSLGDGGHTWLYLQPGSSFHAPLSAVAFVSILRDVSPPP
jgi:hypothetical protein